MDFESIPAQTAAAAVDQSGLWDRVGMSISGICVLHCLLLPVILVSAPLVPALTTFHAWVHPVFAVLLIPTTLVAGWYGQREHGRKGPLLLLALGLAIVTVGGVLGHESPGAALETVLTVAGSAVLVAGHWRNWQLAHLSHAHHHAVPSHAPEVTPAEEAACID